MTKRLLSALCLLLALCLPCAGRAQGYRWQATADISGESVSAALSVTDKGFLATMQAASQGDNEIAATLWLEPDAAPRLQYGAYQTSLTAEGLGAALEPLWPGSRVAARYAVEAAPADLLRVAALLPDGEELLLNALHWQAEDGGFSLRLDEDSLRALRQSLVQAMSDQPLIDALCGLDAWDYFAPDETDRRLAVQRALRTLAGLCLQADLSGFALELGFRDGEARLLAEGSCGAYGWRLEALAAQTDDGWTLDADAALREGSAALCDCRLSGALSLTDGLDLRATLTPDEAAVYQPSAELALRWPRDGIGPATLSADALVLRLCEGAAAPETLLDAALSLQGEWNAGAQPSATGKANADAHPSATGELRLKGLYASNVTAQVELTGEQFAFSALVDESAVSASCRWNEKGYDALLTYFDPWRMITVEAVGFIRHRANGFAHDARLTVLSDGRQVGEAVLHEQGSSLRNGYHHQLELCTLPEAGGSVFTWDSLHRWGDSAKPLSPAVFEDGRVRELPLDRFVAQCQRGMDGRLDDMPEP